MPFDHLLLTERQRRTADETVYKFTANNLQNWSTRFLPQKSPIQLDQINASLIKKRQVVENTCHALKIYSC